MSEVPPIEQQGSRARAAIGRRVRARLAAAPAVERVGDARAELFTMPGFLTDEECAELIAMIERGCKPSLFFIDEADDDYRTSSSCDLDRFDPRVRAIDRRIARLLGLSERHGETVQGQRYDVGQAFRPHCDFFFIDQPYWPAMKASGGQRTWTAMVYLNRPDGGGETRFVNLDRRFEPRPGMLLAWDNMNAAGAPNSWLLHEGAPVTAGVKYIVTKWFRERIWY